MKLILETIHLINGNCMSLGKKMLHEINKKQAKYASVDMLLEYSGRHYNSVIHCIPESLSDFKHRTDMSQIVIHNQEKNIINKIRLNIKVTSCSFKSNLPI